MNTQDKPTKLQELLDDILWIHMGSEYPTGGLSEAIAEAKQEATQAISDLVIESLPEERPIPDPDYTSSDLNVSLQRSITVPIDTAYNQALKDIKSNLAQLGFLIEGE